MSILETIEKGVAWKVIAASPDMMDVMPGSGAFPHMWRSSLAISVFEPPVDDEFQARLCGQRISFVKVSCSITGYEPHSSEATPITFDDRPLEELDRLTSRYLACYGALLNVAFYPLGATAGTPVDPARLPHILDFSPKSRELIRSITEGGEILTGSSRELKFDETRTTTAKSETTVGVEAGYEAAGVKATGKLSHTWGLTEEEARGRTAGAGGSRQVAERFSTTMDQLYSLLTGYHTGTNRGTFVMLARPGVLQPTNRRTFVQGLRMLEGVQDFVFVVARPAELEGLCVEAALDTGHFPETAPLVPEPEPITDTKTFTVAAHVRGRAGLPLAPDDNHGDEIVIGGPSHTFDLQARTGTSDWVLDLDRPGGWVETGPDRSRLHSPDPRHRVPTDGILTHEPARRVIPIGVRAINEHTAEAYLMGGPMYARGPEWGRNHQIDTIVERDFTIHIRKRVPAEEQPADTAHMLVTRRNLSACYRMDDGCPVVSATLDRPTLSSARFQELDTGIKLLSDIPTGALVSGLQRALAGAAANAGRGRHGVTMAETDYFARAVTERLPASLGNQRIGDVLNLSDYGPEVRDRLKSMTVRQLLPVNLSRIAQGASCSLDAAREIRRSLLHELERALKPRDDAAIDLGRFRLYFEFGSEALVPDSVKKLTRLGQLLQENSKWQLRIEGHTDNVGPEEVNQRLSEQRAKVARDYLLEHSQIEPQRLVATGYGSSLPAESNETPEGRRSNRRVDSPGLREVGASAEGFGEGRGRSGRGP